MSSGRWLSARAGHAAAGGERIADAEAFIANLGVITIFGGSGAYYQPATDTVHMPEFGHFRDSAGFYGTWIHETDHA